MAQTSTNDGNLSPLKQAYLALETMQTRVETLEQARREPIAILGMGCRFPGGANCPKDFWDILQGGRDAIEEVPPERWDVNALYDPDPNTPGKVASRYGGFIDNVDQFDASFFGISPREAEHLDPQQRLLLEVTQEAFEHAGVATDRIVNSQTGVFVGLANGDYYCMVTSAARDKIDAYLGTGTSPNAAAGRLSYVFGLRGPCLAVDTACSSSLVALHLACQSLRSGECDMALAGGSNVMLSPELSITFSKAHMLCPDGRCKAFDASANGYVRGEGIGIVVLKRLSAALDAGDRILAVIRGSAVNQDGPSSGLTVPNGPSQQEVIRRALDAGAISPDMIDYLEAHGTGTALGDPIEMGAIGAVFRGRSDPLWVGSVKTNVGHLEGAAGIASVMKVILALGHEEIPPHLHLKTPNSQIPWSELPVRIPTQRRPWRRGRRRRLAGVSSFGFTGINAHVVLEEAPGRPDNQPKPKRPYHLLPLSAKTPEALRQLVRRYVQRFAEVPSSQLADICCTAETGRAHFEHRLAVVAETGAEAGRILDGFLDGRRLEGLHTAVAGPAPGKVAFLFSGPGSHYAGMGRGLYQTESAFRAALDQCEKILQPQLQLPLGKIIRGENSDAALLDRTAYAYPALFALEYALAQVWRCWGVRPSASIGHDVGEYVAACLAGVFSLEDALRLVAVYGRLREDSPVVDSTLSEFQHVAETISLARPRTKLISSLTGAVADDSIARAEYWCEHAQQALGGADGAEMLFAEGIDTFLEIGPPTALLERVRTCWEKGDRETKGRWLPSLQPRRSDWRVLLAGLAELYVAGAAIDWQGFARDSAGHKVTLPSYPFQRRRHWADLPQDSAASARPGTATQIHPLLGWRVHSAAIPGLVQFESVLGAGQPAFLADHRLGDSPLLPATAYMEMAAAAAREVEPRRDTVLENLTLEQPMPLPDGQPRIVQAVLKSDPPGWCIEWYSRPAVQDSEAGLLQWTLHAAGRLTPIDDAHNHADAVTDQSAQTELDQFRERCREEVPIQDFYQQLKQYGLQYGPSFQGLKRLWRGKWEVLGMVEPAEEITVEAGPYVLYPPLFDACLHVAVELLDQLGKSGATAPGSRPSANGEPGATAVAPVLKPQPEQDAGGPRHFEPPAPPATFVPVGLERLRVFRPAPRALWSYARLRQDAAADGSSQYSIDVDVRSVDGTPVARLEGMQVRQVDLALLGKEISVGPDSESSQTALVQRFDVDELRALPAEVQRERVVEFLVEVLNSILKLDRHQRPDLRKNLFDLGLDSLMVVELLYKINRTLNINLSAQSLLDNAAILPLAEEIVRSLSALAPAREIVEAAASASKSSVVRATAPAPAAPVDGRDGGGVNRIRAAARADNRPLPPVAEVAPKETESLASVAAAKMRLFCLSPPGDFASVYPGWSNALRPDVELCAVELPESVILDDATSVAKWPSLVERLTEQILDQLDRPFAFFGHGSGSLLAFDLARAVQDRFGLHGSHLFVARACPPKAAATAAEDGGEGADESAATWRFPAEDLQALQAGPAGPRPPLDCALTAFVGAGDDGFGRDQMQRWYKYTRGSFRLVLTPGTIADQSQTPTRLLQIVGEDLGHALDQ